MTSIPEREASGAAQSDSRIAASQESGDRETIACPPVAARTETELAIAEAVADVLCLDTVDLDASFFELGGHSIHASRLLAKVRVQTAPALTIRAIFEAGSLRALAAEIDEGRAQNSETQGERLSCQQEQIWSHQRMFPESTVYNLGVAWRLTGALDAGAFSRAFSRIVERHDVLRARIGETGGVPFVSYMSAPGRPLLIEQIAADVTDAEIAEGLAMLRDMPMALEKGEVYRARLLQRSPDDHIFFFAPHHIAWDGLCWGVFQRELAAFYEAETGGDASLPALDQRYADFAERRRQWMESEAWEKELAYWRDYYSEDTPALALPADVKRPKLFDYKGGSVRFSVSPETAAAARALAARSRCTSFIVYLAAWQAFLHRVTGQSDIVVGAPAEGRHRAGEADLIGCFGNVLGIRAMIDASERFCDLVSATRGRFYDALEHQEAPIEAITRELRGVRDVSRTPLYQAMFAYQNDTGRARSIGDIGMEKIQLPAASAPADIRLEITENADGATGAVTYANAVMNADGAAYLTKCFEVFLSDALARPDAPAADIAIMTSDERQRLLFDWNETARDYRRDALACDYFDDAAAERPDAPAVSMGDASLSYAGLQSRANKIAHLLRGRGVKEGDIVAVYQDRTIDMVASILGVWKAGAALLPIDPGFPQNRLAYMLEDANARAVITTAPLIEDWLTAIAPAVDLEACTDELSQLPETAPVIDRAAAAGRAYVIYTSGSTGDPKGVENAHGALGNFIESMRREPGMSASDRVLAVTTISFDVMLLELFVTLAAGAEIVLASDDDAMDGFALAEIIERRDITVLQGTPATWRILFDADWRGKADLKALCGGEAMPSEIADRLPKMVGELWNMYGPTETTVWSTCARIESAADIHVGRPIQNTQIYILDDFGAPTPAGVAGDIWIGGDGVALGYLGKPDLTAERFRDNPFDPLVGRIYNTGDRARWRRDGVIEILGRRDEQVKVRGYRIELGDIEAAIIKHPAVRATAVALRNDHSGEASIVAYVVYKEGASATGTELRRFMREHVPHYMTPQFFMELPALPLTNNNKVDRKALPAPAGGAAASRRISPRTPQEIALAEIWRDILHAGDISVTDNFFELGGQSLQAARMIARARDAIGLSLTPRSVIFESLEQLALNAAAA